MGVTISRGRQLPIGVDLGSTAAKLLQLRQSEDRVELLAAATVEIPPPLRADRDKRLAHLAGEIRRAVKTCGFKGTTAVLSLPAEETFVHHVRIPKTSSEVDAAVRAELDGKLPYPVSQAIVRHVVAGDVLGGSEPRQEVITVSTWRRGLEGYLNMARRAHLDVVAVNIESCAVVECFARLFRRDSDAARTILFVDIGQRTTQAVLSHGSRIVFARNLNIGGEQFDQAVAEAESIDIAEANARRREIQDAEEGDTPPEADRLYGHLEGPITETVDQLNQCLRYYESVFRGQSIERAIFVGGQARDKRLCQEIARRLNLPAQIGDPLTRVTRAAGSPEVALDMRHVQPDWAVAVGLSLGTGHAA